MKNRTISIIIILCVAFAIPLSTSAQQSIKLKLDTVKGLQEAREVGSISILNASKAWSTSKNKPDSILWEFVLQYSYTLLQKFKAKKMDSTAFAASVSRYHLDTSGLDCKGLSGTLYILVKRTGDSEKICLLRQYNPFLDKEIIISYPSDSIDKWTLNNFPDSAIRQIKINFPFWIKNQVKWKQLALYLIPFRSSLKMTYNDKRLNVWPAITILMQKLRVARLGNNDIYVYKQNYVSDNKNSIDIKIKENGKFPQPKIMDGLHYKETYKFSDTLVINKKTYKMDSLDPNWRYISLHPVKTKAQKIQLSEKYLKQIEPYFAGSKNYMVIDFWGTWCGPCIAKMPELRTLYGKVKGKFNFLSILVDKPENKTKSKEILRKNDIEWPQLFNDINNTDNLAHNLPVTNFPFYMIIDRRGEIIFANYGTEGFNELENLVLK